MQTAMDDEQKSAAVIQSFYNLQHALSARRRTRAGGDSEAEELQLDDNKEKSDERTELSADGIKDGREILSDFMLMSNEPITWVESIELWYGMLKTNVSSFPSLETSIETLLHPEGATRLSCDTSKHMDTTTQTAITLGTSTHKALLEFDEEVENGNTIQNGDGKKSIDVYTMNNLSPEQIIQVARGIKEIYGIRQSNDRSEFKFVMGALIFLWLTTLTLVVLSQFYSYPTLGKFTWKVIVEAIILFIAELLWECVLSALVLKFNIKINYTRKLGNLFKVPKYFVADFFPFYESTAVSMMSALVINQTLFCLMYYRSSREKYAFFSYIFLSQDKREDRPDTLIFQVTEDIMRFSIYFPFKLFVANYIGVPALIFIPVAVNNIGDGLAEPVGVACGRHKYSTTALYHKGKFFKSKFTRSYEGSACVFITTLVVVAIYYNAFSTVQFWITISLLPLLMTVAEAKAPHTNDGPFLALVGCSFLSAVLLS